ncbi:MAG: hypothetical protein JXA20_19095 [Spirochaetes bacterium]|nr:hypothetical protein [Spirochaetota bacterium]
MSIRHVLITLLTLFVMAGCDGGVASPDADHDGKFDLLQQVKYCPGLRELRPEDVRPTSGYRGYRAKNSDGAAASRINVCFDLFPRETEAGMDLGDFATQLKTHQWLKMRDIDVITDLGGLVPLRLLQGNTAAVIRIAGYPPAAMAIYFSVPGEAGKEELFHYLKSRQPMDTAVRLRGLTVLEAVLFMEADREVFLLSRGRFADVFVEKTIYHSPKTMNFLLKFIIRNTADRTIGVDLQSFWRVFYPNQWGLNRKPYREVIDERRITPDTVVDNAPLLFRYAGRRGLQFIARGKTLAYYREWNGSGEKIHFTNPREYLIISIDGQLLITDGTDVENLSLRYIPEVAFSHPLSHKTIDTAGAMIIMNDR